VRPAPRIGEDSEAILGDAGYSEAEIGELVAGMVIAAGRES
jgi:crotonobetainyl-CoA:carnitine CoA-transferase CaiB-like acyl-CoA transferase